MIREYEQIIEIMSSFQEIVNMLKDNDSTDKNLINDLYEAMKEINSYIFGSPEICINNSISYADMLLNGNIELNQFIKEVDLWRDLIITTVHERCLQKNIIDRNFYKMADSIRVLDHDKLFSKVVNNLKEVRASNEALYQKYVKYYNYFKDYWGDLDLDKGNFGVIEQRLSALIDHLDDFIWLYERLGDYRSKNVLYNILYYWIHYDCDKLVQIKENIFVDYYDLDLLECDENEVLVDIGAYVGDSAKSFIDTYGNYQKIYCYEITESSFEKCKQTLSGYKNIIFRNCGVGSKNEVKYLRSFGSDNSSNTLQDQGNVPINIVTIDKDISDKITLIKMDIEGGEQDALAGCRKHITNEHPKLTICTYHNNEDIWKIPRMIDEMYPDYKFYMRYNGVQLGPTEYVFFAL